MTRPILLLAQSFLKNLGLVTSMVFVACLIGASIILPALLIVDWLSLNTIWFAIIYIVDIIIVGTFAFTFLGWLES